MRRLFLLALPLLLTGCPTIWQFNALKDQVADLQEENRRLHHELERAGSRIENLDTKYDSELGKILEKGATSSAQVDELELEQTRLKGRLEEFEFFLGKVRETIDRMASMLDDRFGFTVQAVPDYAPKGKEERLAFATERLGQGDAKLARSVLRTLLDEHPSDELADDAQFLVGESFFAEKKYNEAIREYRAVHDRYRKSPLVLKALLRIGECFEATEACRKAIQIYEYAQDFAKAKDERADLGERLKRLRKACK